MGKMKGIAGSSRLHPDFSTEMLLMDEFGGSGKYVFEILQKKVKFLGWA